MWYEMDGVLNIVTQKHQKISEYKTLVVNQQEFQFYGIMKIIGFFKPTGFNTEAFKTQTRIYLNAFKDFVENKNNAEHHKCLIELFYSFGWIEKIYFGYGSNK